MGMAMVDNRIASKYEEYERRRLSKRRKRDIGAGRKFKLELKDRFLMLLVYYRLYITYTFSGFLFDLDQWYVSGIDSGRSAGISELSYNPYNFTL